ncbi:MULTISPECIES: Gfo/Idh/MocA family protein [Desulfosediminicola]|uniref:Gfo/Idh/MocA family protein n=1 Tax=Desulfosediminicola TaxID=2886823 RepID=UPI0010AD94D6|nr:Gfo/Idh/MocA family oxidoreductase [Desulfosediminicola ganghwensis]
MADNTIRVGIIGTGTHGSRYANHVVNDVEGLVLAATSRRSINGKEQAKEWGATFHDDWRELVSNEEVQAIIAVVPPKINLDIARYCAELGKPLLMEKPLGRNGGEAGEIVAVLEAQKSQLTVGQTLRYNPVIQALQYQLPTMGKLHSFAVNQRIEPSSLAWHDDPDEAGAGVVIHTAVHIFDSLRVITGQKITRVIAAARSFHGKRLEDLVTMLAEFEDGTIGTVDVSKVGNARSGRWEFICQEGQLHGEQIFHRISRIVGAQKTEEEQFKPSPTILHLLTDWRDFLLGKIPNPVSGEDGLYTVKVCDACLRSARTGGWVSL